MPEDKNDLIDVGETEGAEINLDEKGEAIKQEEVKEEIQDLLQFLKLHHR
jgi:hypothetical protein